MSYSIEQRVWTAIWFEESKSIAQVQHSLRSRFGRHSQAPQRALILRWHENLFKFGNVLHRQEGSGRPRTARSEENKEAVTATFTSSPRKSTRRARSEMDISYSTICRILDESGFKAYKMKVLHAIQPDDMDRRVEFCQWGLQMIEDDDRFLRNLIFSDEAIFRLSGHVNKQNCRIWGTEEPSEFVEEPLHSEKVMVWLALSFNGLIGPFFFADAVSGESYLQMLKEFFLLSVSSLDNLEELWFMQDGAPPHFSTNVRCWLDEHFPNKWIGRRGAVEWPPRSPDLTPLDFFVWGHLEQMVYASKPANLSELQEKIRDGVRRINSTEGLLRKVLLSFRHRLHICLLNNGDHIEQLKDCHLNT